MKRVLSTCLIVLAALALTVTGAKTDTITYNLGIGNPGLSGYTGPYATVLVDLTGSTATITVTGLANGGYVYFMGDGGSIGVNVNAATWTLGPVTGTNASGFTPGPFSNGGSGNEDGFGSFNQRVTSFDGFTHSSATIMFTLTETDPSTNWASASEVLTANALGYLAAAHIFVANMDLSNTNVTGFAANGTPVPEPATLLLLGAGLAGLGFAARRRRKKA